MSSAAAAAPLAATDWFIGTAVIPGGQTSPVQIDPHDVTVRADGAIGLGYRYEATGQALGQAPGTFTYSERGYLYFRNPVEPTTMIGSQFSSGVFDLTVARTGQKVRIADTAPAAYTSGIRTVPDRLTSQVRKSLSGLAPKTGPLTYGYFTFTDSAGTFTGYATPDFTRFVIQITFDMV